MSELSLHVNGEPVSLLLADDATLQGLLDQLEVQATRGVAVALNDHVIPRAQWASTSVARGDRVEIIRATQGG